MVGVAEAVGGIVLDEVEWYSQNKQSDWKYREVELV